MSRKFLGLLITVLALVAVLSLAGCRQQPSEEEGVSSVTTERIRVSGSGTSLPLIKILTDEYSKSHPEVEFVYLPGLHSGGGIRGVAAGDLELGAVSREFNDEEEELGLKYVHLSDDGLVVAAHPSVRADDITSEQLREVYRGEHDNWAALGGGDTPMTILDRNEDESAKIILRQYVLGPDLRISTKAVNLFYESDMVTGLQSTPGAIGYFSLGFGLSEEVPVHYLDLDGAAATVENIADGTYQMVRPLGLVAAESVSPTIDSFLEWVQSKEAMELARESGFASPLSKGE